MAIFVIIHVINVRIFNTLALLATVATAEFRIILDKIRCIFEKA